ncbi:cysteine-rich venom protein tigrin-like [Amia ocellicauda]|uniref:cysteine-rich venom protein tigrin-like n=1 Tax=Amia ocellicauda TaxID=2972642 RepID=UPI0034645F3E
MLKMSWSDEAASNALSWAQTCSGMHSESQQRTINGMRCGENLFMASDLSAWEKGIQDWYNEVQNLTYNVGRAGVVGHYTQVVWYRSNLVGCAIAHCPDEELFHYFYVCHYCPPGNYADSLYTPYKAGPPCGDCPNSCEDKLCNNPCELFDKSSSCKQMLTKYKNGCQYEPIQSMCAASCGCGDKIY